MGMIGRIKGSARSWEGAADLTIGAVYGSGRICGLSCVQRAKAPSQGEGRALPGLVARARDLNGGGQPQ